jgi:hypothetical protein
VADERIDDLAEPRRDGQFLVEKIEVLPAKRHQLHERLVDVIFYASAVALEILPVFAFRVHQHAAGHVIPVSVADHLRDVPSVAYDQRIDCRGDNGEQRGVVRGDGKTAMLPNLFERPVDVDVTQTQLDAMDRQFVRGKTFAGIVT